MIRVRKMLCGLGILTAMTASFAGVFVYVQANKLSEAEEEKKELEREKKELDSALSGLENDKADIIAYINKIDTKINKVTADYEKTEEKIDKKKKSIKKLTKKIEQAEIEINNQYDSMKKRIKYMYENGNSDYIDILLASGSLSEMLNKSEYIEKISDYDANMLDNYIAGKKELEEKKIALEEKKAALEIAAEALAEEKSALGKLEKKKKKEIELYNADIAKTQQAISNNRSELERQEKIIEDELLKEQIRIAEEEKRRKEEEERKRQEELRRQQQQNDSNNNSQNGPTAAPAVNNNNSAGGFVWPLAVTGKITSPFGNRNSPTAGASSSHMGIDISAPTGTAICAAKGGTVVTAAYSAGAGNYVMINHGNGVFTVYMHASSLTVSKGDEVSQGQVIAKVGSTGISTGPHLHFGVSVNGAYVNPSSYVSQ
ncbi:MAG: peptidoglycan DD-metalloendopeptidase family protein [Lachnospiraceae bacterium]|nr:peptidoglycan DD-metalloendopeptidase family protein [Lachnospiraceae bacterium]